MTSYFLKKQRNKKVNSCLTQSRKKTNNDRSLVIFKIGFLMYRNFSKKVFSVEVSTEGVLVYLISTDFAVFKVFSMSLRSTEQIWFDVFCIMITYFFSSNFCKKVFSVEVTTKGVLVYFISTEKWNQREIPKSNLFE